MNEYLNWGKISIASDLNDININSKYESGYVFTRESKGSMYKTRSLRIDLTRFELTSENRRILNKVANLDLTPLPLPLLPENYHWQIHKLGKDYYSLKFGAGVFSAAKIKELLTDVTKSNFNVLLNYQESGTTVGYAICFADQNIIHYAYPFYDLAHFANNYGMGMMLKAINYALESHKHYIYLGSVSRPADVYKLQFLGLEWFDGNSWQQDLQNLKDLLSSQH